MKTEPPNIASCRASGLHKSSIRVELKSAILILQVKHSHAYRRANWKKGL